ncbi:MAG: nucleotidyltransferase domain-containing protein [Candidatus Yonathbacteria bacterium]|nr:nucleotidyltransferase domain-containing protein [Candidatus Yonathbacteria bacterium]
MSILFSTTERDRLTSLGVTTLFLFGSHAEGLSGPLSDYDFAVLLRNPRLLNDTQQKEALYDALYQLLAPLCPRDLVNDVIDIVFLDDVRVPLELKMHVISHGTVLFDGNPRQRADFEERIMELSCDFQPILTMFDRAILQRI